MLEKVVMLENSKEWIDFISYYSDKSFTEQLGLFRYEDVHTNFLASLLDENNIYGYGIKPIQLLLKLIQIRNNNEEGFEYLNSVDLLDNYKICDLIINVRKKLTNGIPDLYITFNIKQHNELKKILIILEAKLGSAEHDDQCREYYNAVKVLNYDEKIFLYLTLDGSKCSSTYYNKITYQDLIDYVYTPLGYLKARDTALTIEEYLKSFNSIYEMEWPKIIYYPITPEGKRLTIDLWQKSSEIDGLWDDDGLWQTFYKRNDKFKYLLINALKLELVDEKDCEKLESYFKKMSSKIYFDDEELNISTGVYTLIKNLADYYKFKNIEDIDSRIIVTTGKWKNIIAEDKIDEIVSPKDKKYYDKDYYLILNGKKYLVVKETSSLEVENLRNVLRECYPDFARRICIKPFIK